MALSVYTGVTAPVVKFRGQTDVAPGFARRIIVTADNSSIALRKMAQWWKSFKFPPVPGEGDEEAATPVLDGMEVLSFEVTATDGGEEGRVVVLG